jgi:hypothetical protein
MSSLAYSLPPLRSSPALRKSSLENNSTRIRSQLPNTREPRRPKTRHSIPPLLRRKAMRATTNSTPMNDIHKPFIPYTIQPRIQEPHRRLPLCNQIIIHQTKDRSSSRCARTRSIQGEKRAVPNRRVVIPLCREIRIRPSRRIIKSQNLFPNAFT